MKTIELLPNTKRLKQVIKQYGPDFEIVRIKKTQCFNYDMGILVKSKSSTYSRWVRSEDIKDESTKI